MEIIFHFRANKTHFQKERLCTWPHFERESFWNLDVAYSTSSEDRRKDRRKSILGDPGADSGGDGKSIRTEK